ncbi:type II toxin-antitoxin system VapB family antitoxin [Candidatus Spongiihabitans sp.]|uniref:type II toxin-antitoxin system VapB family antitoxin n=1 Tax=Candidatus Spongiihabitans sp. TaxID=3101308 RepID=UPI003C7D4CD5
MLNTTLRTNIVLDDNIVQEALKLSNIKTKRALIDVALREFVKNHKKKTTLEELLNSLDGESPFFEGYDYKALRVNPHLPDAS